MKGVELPLEVLMVAEKPSVARLIASYLGSRVRERRGLAAACPVLEFVAVFPPTKQRSRARAVTHGESYFISSHLNVKCLNATCI